MKKLLTIITTMGLVFSSTSSVLACGSKPASNSATNPTNPTKPSGKPAIIPTVNPSRPASNSPDGEYDIENIDDSTLITNNIHDFFAARQFFAKKYNLRLDEFTMYWTSLTTVRFVPMPNTTAYIKLTTLTDYKLDSGYNSLSTNSPLNSLGDYNPLTQLSTVIPYIASLKDASVNDLAWDYFQILEYMTGKNIDTNAYSYAYKNIDKTDEDDKAIGVLTIMNNKDETDFVNINVDKNALALDQFFDTRDTYQVYLPQEIVNMTGADFNAIAASGKSGPFQAFFNYYLATSSYASNFYLYFQDDLVDILGNITTSSLVGVNDYVKITKTLNSDSKTGILNLKIKMPTNKIKSDSGIYLGDENQNWFDFNMNFTTEMPTTDSYNYFARYILKKDSSNKEVTKGIWAFKDNILYSKIDPIDGINELTKDAAWRKKWEVNPIGKQYVSEYEFNKFKLSTDDLKNSQTIKAAFIKELNSVTGSSLNYGIYLDDEISLLKYDGKYYLAPKFGSRLSVNFQRSAMAKTALGILNLLMIPNFQPTAASFVFQLSV